MCVGELHIDKLLCFYSVESRDAKHMTRDVRSAFVNILDKHQESSGWLLKLCYSDRSVLVIFRAYGRCYYSPRGRTLPGGCMDIAN